VLGEEPTRRRGVVVEAVGAAAAFMVDGASLFALVFGLDIIFCVRRWQSYQEANMATENKIWPLSNFVLFLRTCDTKRRCENETNR